MGEWNSSVRRRRQCAVASAPSMPMLRKPDPHLAALLAEARGRGLARQLAAGRAGRSRARAGILGRTLGRTLGRATRTLLAPRSGDAANANAEPPASRRRARRPPPEDDANASANAELPDRRFARRLVVAAVLLTFACLGLLGRLFALQVVDRARYRALWEQSRIEDPIPAVRGPITDRSGRALLAVTQLTGKSLYAVPVLLTDEQRGRIALALGPVLGLDPTTLYDRLWRYRTRQFVWLRRRLSAQEAAAVAPLVARTSALGLRDETVRQYPHKALAAQVLGFCGADGRGLEGVEARFERVLAGTPGMRTRLRDARGRRLGDADLPSRPPKDGATVRLTLDADIQRLVETALDTVCARWRPVGVSAVVLDPNSGAIRALANRPTYDPNLWRDARPGPDGTPHTDPAGRPVTPIDARRNRAIADAFEPGSIFKPGVMLAALDAGCFDYVNPPSIDCENGAFRIRCTDHDGRHRRTLHDHGRKGLLPLDQVIVKSSNIGMAKVGLRLGTERLLDFLTRAGFGKSTGIELPGEVGGALPKQEHCPEVYTIPSVTMGHAVSVTALQMALVYAAIANGGTLLAPQILEAIVAPDGRVLRRGVRRERRRLFADPGALAFMRRALIEVCTPNGTARRASLARYGITVAGKTGTADRYGGGGTICSFAGFAPAEAPELVVLVSVDRPRESYRGQQAFGGTVAAPAVAEILLGALTRPGLRSRSRSAPHPE